MILSSAQCVVLRLSSNLVDMCYQLRLPRDAPPTAEDAAQAERYNKVSARCESALFKIEDLITVFKHL